MFYLFVEQSSVDEFCPANMSIISSVSEALNVDDVTFPISETVLVSESEGIPTSVFSREFSPGKVGLTVDHQKP